MLPLPGELKCVAVAALAFFGVMLWYFPLRSLRDALAAERKLSDLPWLFSATWLGMLVVQPPFAALVARWPRRRSLGTVFHTTTACLLLFYWLVPSSIGAQSQWMGAVFYVWLSVFNLFTISLAWAVFTDCFSHAQAKRVFGWVGLGGTLGAIAGSRVAQSWADSGGDPLQLLLFSALVVELAWPLLAWILRHPMREPVAAAAGAKSAPKGQLPAHEAALGGGLWEGVRLTVSNPVLALIAIFMLTQTAASAFLYSEQQALVGLEFTDRAARTAWLARTELWGQVATLTAQVFVTGPLLSSLGVPIALVLYPLGSMLLFLWLGLNPGLAAVFAARVGMRGLDAACSRPARETLFSLASRAGRFKAKPFLDTFVYRSGDAVGAWMFRFGQQAMQLSLQALAFAAIPLGLAGIAAALALRPRVKELTRDKQT